MPIGRVLCVSVNDAVLHGLPHDRRLRDGDLVGLNFATEVDGWVADSRHASWASSSGLEAPADDEILDEQQALDLIDVPADAHGGQAVQEGGQVAGLGWIEAPGS